MHVISQADTHEYISQLKPNCLKHQMSRSQTDNKFLCICKIERIIFKRVMNMRCQVKQLQFTVAICRFTLQMQPFFFWSHTYANFEQSHKIVTDAKVYALKTSQC